MKYLPSDNSQNACDDAKVAKQVKLKMLIWFSFKRLPPLSENSEKNLIH